MNRILTAEVILTLTRDQAQQLLAVLGALVPTDLRDAAADARAVLREQCAKQGVQS